MGSKNIQSSNEIILFDNGANWLRADFHLHSPGVHSFKLPSGINLDSDIDKNKNVESYIEQLKNQNIKTGAITDYQQVRKDWFPLFQKKALEEKIYIFPGIELSINLGRKIHILFIFEFDQELEAINRFIVSLDQNPHEALLKGRQHRDINLKSNFEESIQSLKSKFSCLIILPHPGDENGIIKELQPKQAAKILKIADGIEYLGSQDKERVFSTNIIPRDFFDNFAILENSDPKSIDEIGTKTRNNEKRSTYLKLGSLSVDGFKIALHDPGLRVRLYNKPELHYDRISSIKIKGSFLKEIRIDFNPEQNTLIGGRGVGKSAILEALRYALNLPIYSDESFRTEFVNSVVGSGGVIQILIDRFHGGKKDQYLIERIIGQLPEVYDSARSERFEMEPKEVFSEKTIPIILGQKELYHLSLDVGFQLRLIDEFIGADIQKENLEFEKLLGQLNENANQLLQIEDKLEKLEEYQQRLTTLNSHIRTYEKLKVVEKLKRHTDLIEDEKELSAVGEKLNELNEQFESLFTETESELNSLKLSLKTGKSEFKNLLIRDASELVTDLYEQLKGYQTEIQKLFDKKIKDFATINKKWKQSILPIKEEINQIKRKLESEGLSPEKYESIVKEKLSVQTIIDQLKRVTSESERLLTVREEIKRNIREKRHHIFEIRKEKISELNQKLQERLKIDIHFEADTRIFLDTLKNLTKGSKIREDVLQTMTNPGNKTIDGLELSKYMKLGQSAIIENFNLTETMAKRFIDWFSNNKRLYKLETLFPADQIVVKLKVGEEYKPLEKLSVGQKATALLLLLFMQEKRILIIDQPEEDLDNRFIYEDVVKILREMKEKRQIIVATHNANIPVLGDSELITVLNATNDVCRIENAGSIDKKSIREDVKTIMEGGEEAFRKRAEKYGGF